MINTNEPGQGTGTTTGSAGSTAGGAGLATGTSGAGVPTGSGGISSTATGSSAPLGDSGSAASADTGSLGSGQGGGAASMKEHLTQHTSELKQQARDKALEFASQGKEKTTGLLDTIAQLLDDTAARFDDQLGQQFGNYGHQAAGLVSNLTETLRSKDVEELVDDVRDMVRRNPALTIGAAAVAGFALIRLIKAASDDGLDDPAAGYPDDAALPTADDIRIGN